MLTPVQLAPDRHEHMTDKTILLHHSDRRPDAGRADKALGSPDCLRNGVLFTMSNNAQTTADQVQNHGSTHHLRKGLLISDDGLVNRHLDQPSSGRHSHPVPTHRMVEPDGIEPTTSCLQSTRSPN